MSLKKNIIAAALLVAIAGAASAADAIRVYSIQGADCGDCGTRAVSEVKKIKGVHKASFDKYKVELSVEASDKVTDEQVLNAIAHAEKGLHGVAGAGHGAYLPVEKYPEGADVVFLTNSGEAVGPLEKLRVPGKYTVFDVYADWCGPCRSIDAKLRETVAKRRDVAVRKLNVVSFESPLAKEFGASLTALPHVVVFSPSGKRTEFTGADLKKLAAGLGS
jgi:thiol-disulfide isomerase/thioredoxin